jgi:polysaccharide export outer membrane protein
MTGIAVRPALLLALLLALPSGCAQLPTLPPDPDPSARTGYVIGAGDLLKVSVWKNPDLTQEAVPVRPDGKISIPLANDVQAAGLTPIQLKDVLTQALSEYVTAPDVTVIVVQMNSRRVSVEGEVQRPGTVPLASDTRVVDALTQAGGFTPFASRKRIKILRRNADGSVSSYGFNYDAFVAGDAPGSNGLLESGDTVVVPD